MNATLLIDSVNYSFLLPRKGYNISHKKVLGSNSCYTLDGKYHEDVLAYKAVIKVDLLPMTSTQLSELVNAVQNCKNATYFDTMTNSVVTREVNATLESASLVFNTSKKAFWSDTNQKGITLTIEEK